MAATVLLIFVGAACSGGGGEHSSARLRASERQPVVTSRPRSTTTVAAVLAPRPTTPVTSGSPATGTDRVPPPVILDRGDRHVAIVRSLLYYGRWLAWHHRDPALVTRAYEPGGALARGVTTDITTLRRVGRHITEVDDAPPGFMVVSVLANVVSFRVTEHLARRELVDADGKVVTREGPATEHTIIMITRFTPAAPWRLDLVATQEPLGEVHV